MKNDYVDKFNDQLPIQELLLPAATGTVLRRVREFKGWTQTKVSEIAKMNLSYISNVENGLSNISIVKLYHICNALDISPVGVHARISHLLVSVLKTSGGKRSVRELAFLIGEHSSEALNVHLLVAEGFTASANHQFNMNSTGSAMVV